MDFFLEPLDNNTNEAIGKHLNLEGFSDENAFKVTINGEPHNLWRVSESVARAFCKSKCFDFKFFVLNEEYVEVKNCSEFFRKVEEVARKKSFNPKRLDALLKELLEIGQVVGKLGMNEKDFSKSHLQKRFALIRNEINVIISHV